jgi:CRISPR-associated protein Csx10
MKKTLKITLKSDLCIGVGKHFAAVIDFDTALDEYGIPYIPSRRLKGYMREMVEILEIEDADSIFGIAGNDIPGSLTITDARIKDYDEIVREIRNNSLINPNSVAELFCSVRSETAIKNNTVKDKSLRFIRVVNQYSPFEKYESLQFFANIEFDDSDYNTMKKICKALRNIGYHRNRGLGVVKCELLPEAQYDKNEFAIRKPKAGLEADKWYELEFSVYLNDDMMLPATDANHSLDYIPGTAVMGALASKYVKSKGAKLNNKEFNAIFISNDVRFGNLYITDEDGDNYLPAPRFLAKIKAATSDSDRGVKNLIAVNIKKDGDQANKSTGEEKPKTYQPIQNGYINKDLVLKNPKTKIVYHNAIRENGIGLYMQYCLCSGQYFKGTIQAKGEKMDVLCSLLDENISFGRSKTAQYSHCTIQDSAKIRPINDNMSMVDLSQGKIAAYVLESDVILTDDNGVFTTEINKLCELLGIDITDLRIETNIATRIISGYNAKWNKKKPQIPAIRAGSTIVFEVLNNKKGLSEYICIGEKQNEGFGRVRLINDAKAIATKRNNNSEKSNIAERNQKACGKRKDTASVEINKKAKMLIDKINERKLDDEIIAKAIENFEGLRLNASQVGRIILMCKEAEKLDDFIRRVESIKSDEVRETVKKSFAKNRLEEVFSEFLTASYDISPDFRWEKYKKYILTALTVKKYKLRGEDK